MHLRFSLQGVADVLRALRLLERVPSRPSQERAVFKGGEVIAREARRLVPVRSGNLRDSIEVRLGDGGGSSVGLSQGGVSVSVGPSQREGYYGHMVEFGTVNMPPRPFMRPAFDARRRDAERVIADAVKVEIRRAGGD